MVASTIISGSSELAHDRTVASSLHLRSASGMREIPNTSQRSGATHVASCELLHSLRPVGWHPVDSRAFGKPVSENLAQSSHHDLLGPKESSASLHSSSASRRLDGSVAKTETSQ